MKAFLLIPLGFIIGTLAEYLVHRGLHRFFPTFHQAHHDNPTDRSIGGSWYVHGALLAAISLLFAFSLSWLISVGFLLWYVAYAALHYYSHQIPSRQDSWIDFIQDNHIVHHNEPEYNFGVTVPIWDMWPFKTYKRGEDRNA